MPTVFYSWQNELPPKTNRYFIRDCLLQALKERAKAMALDEPERPSAALPPTQPVTLDHDTLGKPGSPEILNTILDKIEACTIFAPDWTMIPRKGIYRQTPNPNVMFETGYAHKVKGPDVFLPIMNEFYGPVENLPFNVRHRRGPILFRLAPNATKRLINSQRARLVGQLSSALEVVLEWVRRNRSTSSDNGTSRLLFHDPARRIVAYYDLGGELVDIFDNSARRIVVRVIPKFSPTPIPSDSLLQFAKEHSFGPLSGQYYGSFQGPYVNDYGVIVWSPDLVDRSKLATCTQLLNNGEVWGYDNDLLSPANMPRDKPNFVPMGYLGSTLKNGLDVLRKTMKNVFYSGDVKVIISLMGVKDFRLYTGDTNEGLRGHIIQDDVSYESDWISVDVDSWQVVENCLKRLRQVAGA